MVRQHSPIVVVVMNNHSWAASQHYQETASGANRVHATRLFGGARYDEVAKGFGAFGAHVTQIADLAPALKAAFAAGKPACVNIEIDF